MKKLSASRIKKKFSSKVSTPFESREVLPEPPLYFSHSLAFLRIIARLILSGISGICQSSLLS